MPMLGLFGNIKSAVALMPKTKGGLTKWFKEEWVNIKTGKPCGRKKAKGSKCSICWKIKETPCNRANCALN